MFNVEHDWCVCAPASKSTLQLGQSRRKLTEKTLCCWFVPQGVSMESKRMTGCKRSGSCVFFEADNTFGCCLNFSHVVFCLCHAMCNSPERVCLIQNDCGTFHSYLHGCEWDFTINATMAFAGDGVTATTHDTNPLHYILRLSAFINQSNIVCILDTLFHDLDGYITMHSFHANTTVARHSSFVFPLLSVSMRECYKTASPACSRTSLG